MGHSGGDIMQEKPSILAALSHLKIIAIAAGANHLVALTQEHFSVHLGLWRTRTVG